MKALYNKLTHFLFGLESKIAFYPTVLSILGFLLTFLVLYLDQFGLSAWLRNTTPSLIIEDPQTARTLLSAFIAGMISLMVFSFSMVMILLNQASTNFSPRLLPGLISNRRHQLVLGSFLACLIYCIFILVSIDIKNNSGYPPGFPILIAIVLIIFCLGLFVYFIHSISQSIQVNNILDFIHKRAKQHLEQLLNTTRESSRFPETEGWHEYHADKTGYFQDCITETLAKICKEKELRLEILAVKGSFILKGVPLIRSEKKLEEKTLKQVRSCMIFSRSELVQDNYVMAFKQITEIAVKAMSPGINDPGTALNAIDYLTELFAMRMSKNDENYIEEDDALLIKMGTVTFKQLLYNVMTSLRLYCKHDVIIVQKLTLMFRYLLFQSPSEEHYRKTIEDEANLLLEDASKNIANEKDLQTIKNLAKHLRIS